jgi:glycosyltransferase involved in cell wall biosynthesis
MVEPLVSVIIPTYNRELFIAEAIESALAQTYRNTEIIVVDDGSTDRTAEIVDAYRDSVRYYRQDNKGPAAARNLGIHLSNGQYIAFLDSDDRWLPEKLSMQMELMHKNPSAGMIGCGEHCIDARGNRYWTGYASPQVSIKELMIRCTAMGGASRALVRRECFDVVGLFDESLLLNQDWDMWLKIGKRFEIRNVVAPLVEWRLHHTPRPNRALEFRFNQAKKVIERHVPDKRDRDKAYGWMYYESALVAFSQQNDRLRSLKHLLISFRYSPLRACPEQRRMLLLLECILPKKAINTMAALKRALKGVRRINEAETHPVR